MATQVTMLHRKRTLISLKYYHSSFMTVTNCSNSLTTRPITCMCVCVSAENTKFSRGYLKGVVQSVDRRRVHGTDDLQNPVEVVEFLKNLQDLNDP